MRARLSSTVRGLRNRAAATCRLVCPEAARAATRSSVAVSASGAGGRSPRRGGQGFEDPQGALQVLFGNLLALGPPLHLAYDQQRPPQLERHREVLVVAQGLLQRLHSTVSVAAGRQQ